jgi:hypothetical protein
MTNHKIGYVHDSWSVSNSAELDMFLCVNGSCHGFLTNHMQCYRLESVAYYCTTHTIVVNMSPKMKLQNGVGTEFHELSAGNPLNWET